MDPLGPVVITAREIYDQLVRLTDGIGTMATRMAQMTDALDDSKKDIADHEVRLRSLERGRWPLPSVAVLLSLGALVAAFFGKS